ncbi:MAG: divalent-cation tolerance protein CutA [Candidatus Aenigmatarchaeota archaeon]
MKKIFKVFYITFPSKKEAEKVAKSLLEKKLVFCVNIFKINSMYWWEGKIEKSNEFALIAKTLKEKEKDVRKEVKRLHPYKVPFIGSFDVNVNEEYFDYAKKTLK